MCDSCERLERGSERGTPCHTSNAPQQYFFQQLNDNTTEATLIWTKRIGEVSLAPYALICWLTAERQHCLFNVRRGKGHCIAFVRSAVEVTLSSGPSCCRQLGHATYIESNYPCQLITAQLVPLDITDTQNSLLYYEYPFVWMLVSFFFLTSSHADTSSL